ncbi:hypothetical protein C8R45DRAFT_1081480 [Mycena sanguinolenta]|nr:hypothetical protein C8R45DRAFT_1081480 [Mycena sanguinolenta]
MQRQQCTEPVRREDCSSEIIPGVEDVAMELGMADLDIFLVVSASKAKDELSRNVRVTVEPCSDTQEDRDVCTLAVRAEVKGGMEEELRKACGDVEVGGDEYHEKRTRAPEVERTVQKRAEISATNETKTWTKGSGFVASTYPGLACSGMHRAPQHEDLRTWTLAMDVRGILVQNDESISFKRGVSSAETGEAAAANDERGVQKQQLRKLKERSEEKFVACGPAACRGQRERCPSRTRQTPSLLRHVPATRNAHLAPPSLTYSAAEALRRPISSLSTVSSSGKSRALPATASYLIENLRNRTLPPSSPAVPRCSMAVYARYPPPSSMGAAPPSRSRKKGRASRIQSMTTREGDLRAERRPREKERIGASTSGFSTSDIRSLVLPSQAPRAHPVLDVDPRLEFPNPPHLKPYPIALRIILKGACNPPHLAPSSSCRTFHVGDARVSHPVAALSLRSTGLHTAGPAAHLERAWSSASMLAGQEAERGWNGGGETDGRSRRDR